MDAVCAHEMAEMIIVFPAKSISRYFNFVSLVLLLSQAHSISYLAWCLSLFCFFYSNPISHFTFSTLCSQCVSMLKLKAKYAVYTAPCFSNIDMMTMAHITLTTVYKNNDFNFCFATNTQRKDSLKVCLMSILVVRMCIY